MALSRYEITDSYTLDELRRKYEHSDVQGRIQLLENLYADYEQAPFEIAALAVEDSHVEVRQWIARHSKYLDYNLGIEEKNPDRNLEDRLKNDPDPFVRACLRENPTAYMRIGSDWTEHFSEANHMERLALVRNPEVREELIEKIFNYEDRELGISSKEREELVYAFLTNKEAIAEAEETLGSRISDLPHEWDVGLNLGTLWELASKWPNGTKLKARFKSVVYRYLPADDETKARIYNSCNDPVWRLEILRNCSETDTKTIKVALQDGDKDCRRRAESLNRKPLRP